MIHQELHRRKRIQKDFFESEVCEDDHAIRTDVQSCPLPVCPSWAKWSNWSDCSQSCDGGHRLLCKRFFVLRPFLYRASDCRHFRSFSAICGHGLFVYRQMQFHITPVTKICRWIFLPWLPIY